MTAVDTRIPLRLRNDLRWIFYPHSTQPHWVANDPVLQEYYFFSELERRIASSLNGNATVESILKRESDAVANGILTSESVIQLVSQLNQNSLLLPTNSSTASSRGRSLSQFGLSIQHVVQLLSSIFALRFPILNPTALLTITESLGAILFRRATLYLVSFFVMIALVIVSLNWSYFLQDATKFNSNLHGDRLWITLGLLFLIKLLHELGHGMACVRFGGRCNEFGLIFLFGVPSLYCDVTDSWRLPNRWKRIAIAAGGIYIELILASIACFVWIASDSVGLRGMAVQVMMVCSLMTLILNANPLLRYDGYYILADWIGIPNLGDESRKAWKEKWISFFSHCQPTKTYAIESRSGRNRWLVTYHLASLLYRCLLLVTIAWLAYTWLEHNGMPSVANAIFFGAVGLTLAVAFENLRTGMQVLLQTGRVRWKRFGGGVGVVFVSVCLALLLPMPTSIVVRGYVEPSNMSQLFSRRNAVFLQSAKSGHEVTAGEFVLQLESYELNQEILKTGGEVDVAQVRINQLENRLTDDPDAPQQIVETQQKLLGLKQRLNDLQRDRDYMNIVADRPGVFLDPHKPLRQPEFTARTKFPRLDLQTKVMDRAYADRGEVIGWIGDKNKWLVNALITEENLQNVSIGDSAWIRIDRCPSKTFEGFVKSISAESIPRTPEALEGDSLFNSYKPSVGESLPEDTTYNVAIEVDLSDYHFRTFGLASVKIETKSRTIFNRLYDRVLSRFLLAR